MNTVSFNMFRILRYFLPLFLLSLYACKSDHHVQSNAINVFPVIEDEPEIQLLTNQEVVFRYVLGDTVPYGEHHLITATCTLINNSARDMLYLRGSCNGLESFLISDPYPYKIIPLINCNASWPVISKLRAGDSLSFSTNLLQSKGVKTLQNLGLDFRVVDRFVPSETLRENPKIVERVYRAETNPANVIWPK